MRNWDIKEEEGSEATTPCEAEWQKVQKVCKTLGIPSRRIDFVKEYWSYVFENAIEDYQHGRTPNPDLHCNKEIKFDRLLEQLPHLHPQPHGQASKIWLVTGHYARLTFDSLSGTIQLLRGAFSTWQPDEASS